MKNMTGIRKIVSGVMLMIALMMPVCGAAQTPKAAKVHKVDKARVENRKEMHKEIQEFKIGYLAQEMELNGKDKEKFEALYTKMSAEKRKLYRDTRQLERRVKSGKDISDADYDKAVKALTQAKEKDAAIDKKYDAEFAKFLTSKQIFKMKSAEQEFRSKMRKMHKEKKGGQRRQGK